MRLPRTQTHPAKLRLAALVLADHVVAATVLLDRRPTFGALLGVGRDPVGRFAVVVALFDPLLNQRTADRIVPVF